MSAVCVPFRPGQPDRDANWAYLRARWETGGFEVFEGDNPEERFGCAGSRNLAAEKAGAWDAALIVDADILLDLSSAGEALALARESVGYVAPYDRLHILGPVVSAQVLGGYEPTPRDADKTHLQSWPCAFAIGRPLWDSLDGMDAKAYPGVDFEDVDFVHRAARLVALQRVDGDAYHLWHEPRQGRRL